jgi:predicted 3-demethylubiquinone-9 3-methyltransferase (glyoxalase superfamily)
MEATMSKITPFLMFNDQLEQALDFYRTLFPDLQVKERARKGDDGPLQAAEFTMGGQTFKAFDGGPYFAFSEAFSIYVDCEDQAEVDRFWDAIVGAGGKPTACGWINDRFGIAWQIVPRRFVELTGDPDPVRVKAVVDAMMTMEKLDVAALERAYAEAVPSAASAAAGATSRSRR